MRFCGNTGGMNEIEKFIMCSMAFLVSAKANWVVVLKLTQLKASGSFNCLIFDDK